MGDRGGKGDMDRVGLFQEMGYITINDRYKQGSGKHHNSQVNFSLAIYRCVFVQGNIL